jgi:site-specific DNA recombinase
VRTDRLELAVWHEVCTLLAHPERLAQEFHRRLHADGQQHHQERTALESQVGKLQQGLARLIDSYAEGLIDKQEFEPRVKRLRLRMAQIDAQCQHLAQEETLHRELQLIIGRLDEFAAQVTQNLEELEWSRKRDLIRALVRRVEIALDQVQVVFRVDAFAGEADPEKKSLQLCKRSTHPTLRRPLGTFHQGAIGKLHGRFQPSFYVQPHPFALRMLVDRPEQELMVDVVEETFDIKLQYPVIPPAPLPRHADGLQG